MRDPELDLRVAAPVGTVVQVGRVLLEPAAAPPVDGVALTGLVGREGELGAVLRALAAGAPGVVLTGGPGVGTTAVALAAAARLSGRYPGGVRFVPLTGPDPGPALRELLRDLGVRAGEIPPATPHRTVLLRAVLAAAPTLLVLDDARSAAQVRALLPGGGSAVLVTSAGPLDELHLDGLAPVVVPGLPPAAAAALLPGADHDVPARPPAPGRPGHAAALLETCHGSPLAVRLLAGACPTPAAAVRALTGSAPPRDAAAAARAAARIALAALPAAEREVLEAVRATGLPLVDPARCAAVLPDGLAGGAPVDPLLRALLRRGLLSPRPGPGTGPWCALPRAVAEVLPADPAWAALPASRPAALDPPTPADHPGVAPDDRPGPPAYPPHAVPAADSATLLQRLVHHAAAHADPVVGADALVHLAAARTRRGDDTAALAAATAGLDLADRAGDPVLLGRAAHRLAAALAGAAEPAPTAPTAAPPPPAPPATPTTPTGPATATPTGPQVAPAPAVPPPPVTPAAPAVGAAYPAGLRDARAAFDLAVDLLAGRDDAAHAHALLDRAHLARRRDRPAEALADLHAALALFRTLGRPADVAAAWQEVAAVERAAGHPCRAVAAHRSALAALAEAGDPAATGWSRLAAGLVQVGEAPGCPDLVAARLADSPAARSVRELRELDPAAPDWALVAALTGGFSGGQ
ncbi:hypothetical protein LWC35_17225 [Pseudonocardia kujensis]|uniref:hypothetical protein n=1 Tax=Pseudonocardia kujensis TaxID=1128675 RepID=UPI001E36D092|nr:hypothetical protein [Pseudonocardia kujensis]MCE0764638.1 hypothetical protein [Pseudonocardia kujensis]